jgi:hypothetical protein
VGSVLCRIEVNGYELPGGFDIVRDLFLDAVVGIQNLR